MADFDRLYAINHSLGRPITPIRRPYPRGPNYGRATVDEKLDAYFLAGARKVFGDFWVYERDEDGHAFGVMVTRLFDPRFPFGWRPAYSNIEYTRDRQQAFSLLKEKYPRVRMADQKSNEMMFDLLLAETQANGGGAYTALHGLVLPGPTIYLPDRISNRFKPIGNDLFGLKPGTLIAP